MTAYDLGKVPVLILAGGLGTRLGEETERLPKPMIEIGGTPILVHIINTYQRFGFKNFIICAGYRAREISQYFLLDDLMNPSHRRPLGARIRVIDTGVNTMTGARISRALKEIPDDFDDFAVTYGDGLSAVNLAKQFFFHKEHGKIGTLLGALQPSRFGQLKTDATHRIVEFEEKPHEYINGGFFFFRRAFEDELDDAQNCVLETGPLRRLSARGELFMYPYAGFWHCMDTARDKAKLNELWDSGNAPWITDSKE